MIENACVTLQRRAAAQRARPPNPGPASTSLVGPGQYDSPTHRLSGYKYQQQARRLPRIEPTVSGSAVQNRSRHCDRRFQFTSGVYPKFLGGNAPVCSMSAVGHCADNAACEGFFGLPKRERVQHRRYRARHEARADLSDYLERFHNPRMHRRVARRDREFSALTQPSAAMK